jgi:hypothetical protein
MLKHDLKYYDQYAGMHAVIGVIVCRRRISKPQKIKVNFTSFRLNFAPCMHPVDVQVLSELLCRLG